MMSGKQNRIQNYPKSKAGIMVNQYQSMVIDRMLVKLSPKLAKVY